jgi:hypothetical protein
VAGTRAFFAGHPAESENSPGKRSRLRFVSPWTVDSVPWLCHTRVTHSIARFENPCFRRVLPSIVDREVTVNALSRMTASGVPNAAAKGGALMTHRCQPAVVRSPPHQKAG